MIDKPLPKIDISNIQELPKLLSRDEFKKIKNIFFDLDGTLHDFRTPSRTAMNEVYEKIVEKFSLQKTELQKMYGEILAKAEKEAFRENKTSQNYRTERFAALLKHFSISDEQFVAELVKTYGDLFEKNLKIDDSTLESLKNLSSTYKLYLITEGPLDAQIRTIEKLGMKDLFAKIFTSGQYGEVKETGRLFDAAKDALKLSADDIVIVGDNPARDVRGANLAGIKSILAKISFV